MRGGMRDGKGCWIAAYELEGYDATRLCEGEDCHRLAAFCLYIGEESSILCQPHLEQAMKTIAALPGANLKFVTPGDGGPPQ
jgi:hypothetical protein